MPPYDAAGLARHPAGSGPYGIPVSDGLTGSSDRFRTGLRTATIVRPLWKLRPFGSTSATEASI